MNTTLRGRAQLRSRPLNTAASRWHRLPAGADAGVDSTNPHQHPQPHQSHPGPNTHTHTPTPVPLEAARPRADSSAPTPPTPPPPPDFLPETTINKLFSLYLESDIPLPEIAGDLGIPLTLLIRWHDHPHTRHTLSELDRLARERAAHKAAQSAPAAVSALIAVAQQCYIKPEPARKAAAALLKHHKDTSPSPIAVPLKSVPTDFSGQSTANRSPAMPAPRATDPSPGQCSVARPNSTSARTSRQVSSTRADPISPPPITSATTSPPRTPPNPPVPPRSAATGCTSRSDRSGTAPPS